jgi:hypothetical protein
MADKELVFLQLKKLEAAYNHMLTDEQVDVYLEVLAPYDFAFIWSMAQKYMQSGERFFPRPGDLIYRDKDGDPVTVGVEHTEYFSAMKNLHHQRENAGTDPFVWETIAGEYDKMFAFSAANACRKRAEAYA